MPQRSTKIFLRYFVFLCGFLFFLPCQSSAASLFGKVIEVNSGDVITIFNLNRPVRVKLLGVDAPEMDQTFGDVAKKHLSDLVFDKSVLVEYSGISADSSLTGRVLLNNADIGAQMIRDGAAWFDVNNVSRLSVPDREIYQQSELAARNERRGLWQAEHPIAPWEFVKAQALRQNPVGSLPSTPSLAKTRENRPRPELTNLSLLSRNVAATPAAQTPDVADAGSAWALSAVRKEWGPLQPEGENFSALVPQGGDRRTIPVPSGSGETVDTHVYMVRDGESVFSISWMAGPTGGETDRDALTYSMRRFVEGIRQGFEAHARSVGQPATFSCELENEKDISRNGYTGSEFDLSSCTVRGYARIFTRVVDNKRQMYVATTFYTAEDENVMRFIKSFSVGPSATKKHKSHK
jgi:endonuclease YncB( thermonuclease family)